MKSIFNIKHNTKNYSSSIKFDANTSFLINHEGHEDLKENNESFLIQYDFKIMINCQKSKVVT